MGLIDADKLKDAECKMCQFCLTNSKGIKDIEGCREMGCGVMQLVDRQPTIEAIPVEQVAESICKVVDWVEPCDFLNKNLDKKSEPWCDSHCYQKYSRNKVIECWLHALKEGWLDDD